MKHSRRSFITTAGLALPAIASTRAAGSNEAIRVGFIGLGGRGMGSVNWFSKIKDVDIAYFCDPDSTRIAAAQKKFPNAKGTADLRKLIEDMSIDAVVVSTCNHWHALAAIWAIQAGKDVYVEKPVSHNVWEGRKIVEAARKYKRIVQGGTQQRSDKLQGRIKEYLDTGELGKIKYVRCNRYGQRGSIGKRNTPLAPPKDLDYDLWLGPAQDIEIFREKFHYDWHWDFNCGNGELGNWGPHILDDLRNVVFRDKIALPKRVLAGGGRLGWDDAGTSPNTHFVYMDTGEIPVIVDVHNLPRAKGVKGSDVYKKRRTGAFLIIECENGYYAGGRGGGAAYSLDGKKIKSFKGDGGGAHAQNFIDAVRSRKIGDLNAEIEQIHYSSAWCHLGNVSWQLGQANSYDRGEAEQRVKDFQPWNEVIGEFHEHVKANQVDLDKYDVRIGVELQIDPEKETFVGDTATPKALSLLSREYRKGYEVPDKV